MDIDYYKYKVTHCQQRLAHYESKINRIRLPVEEAHLHWLHYLGLMRQLRREKDAWFRQGIYADMDKAKLAYYGGYRRFYIRELAKYKTKLGLAEIEIEGVER